tara:strand:- start:178 stop:1080 length:903 start_codon:yes stop_codon:yes gene_type:complete
MENVSREAENFISKCVHQFLYSEKIKSSTSGECRSFYYAKDSSLLEMYDFKALEERYSQKMRQDFNALVHDRLKKSNQYRDNGYPFLYYKGIVIDCFILGDFNEFIVEVVPDTLRKELIDFCLRRHCLINSKYLDGTYDKNLNVFPILKFEPASGEHGYVEMPQKLFELMEHRTETMFDTSDDVFTQSMEDSPWGDTFDYTVKAGAEGFLEVRNIIDQEALVRHLFRTVQEKELTRNPRGVMFFFYGDECWAETRIGARCAIFAVPKPLIDDAYEYATKIDSYVNLNDFASINSTNNVDK